MILRPNPYPQRRRLDHADGCEPRPQCGPAAALACYNTDSTSSQTQQSIQTGADQGAVALNNVTVNFAANSVKKTKARGKEIELAPVAAVDGGGSSTQILSINTDANAGNAISALQNALSTTAANTDKVTETLSALIGKENAAATGTTGFNTLQYVASVVSIAAGALLAYKFIFHRK